jgi:hypothetical protein
VALETIRLRDEIAMMATVVDVFISVPFVEYGSHYREGLSREKCKPKAPVKGCRFEVYF